jgi:hypothetical protein
MIVYVLFVHKKSVSKRKVCVIFIKNKNLKNPKKTFVVGFLGVFFVFFWWVFIANPVNTTSELFVRQHILQSQPFNAAVFSKLS